MGERSSGAPKGESPFFAVTTCGVVLEVVDGKSSTLGLVSDGSVSLAGASQNGAQVSPQVRGM